MLSGQTTLVQLGVAAPVGDHRRSYPDGSQAGCPTRKRTLSRISAYDFSAMPFSCPPVCIRKPANSELSSKHRAPMLHYDWFTQPHLSLVLQNLSAFQRSTYPILQ